jgi:hypothetical protein
MGAIETLGNRLFTSVSVVRVIANDGAAFKSSDFTIPDFRNSSTTLGDMSSRFLSTPSMTSLPASLVHNGTTGRNVGDFMCGDDLGFLNHYFAPSMGLQSGLANDTFSTIT